MRKELNMWSYKVLSTMNNLFHVIRIRTEAQSISHPWEKAHNFVCVWVVTSRHYVVKGTAKRKWTTLKYNIKLPHTHRASQFSHSKECRLTGKGLLQFLTASWTNVTSLKEPPSWLQQLDQSQNCFTIRHCCIIDLPILSHFKCASVYQTLHLTFVFQVHVALVLQVTVIFL